MMRKYWFEILLVVVVMTISAYAAFSDAQNLSNRWFIRDDAYYYFKVAQNISEGHGSTFDGINPTNGYHPLWLWINIPIFALARFDLILPLRILLLVSSGLTAATAILLHRLLGKVFSPAIGAIAAIYWAFSRDILTRVYQQGLETGIAAFFIALFAYKLFEFEKSWRTQPVTARQLATTGRHRRAGHIQQAGPGVPGWHGGHLDRVPQTHPALPAPPGPCLHRRFGVACHHLPRHLQGVLQVHRCGSDHDRPQPGREDPCCVFLRLVPAFGHHEFRQFRETTGDLRVIHFRVGGPGNDPHHAVCKIRWLPAFSHRLRPDRDIHLLWPFPHWASAG
ncbi:MAG: hypothetical protein MZV64_23070 [Ignavibacteriales bacterium]|nr:hypothetical protein [Ignavibacteriales bacterium]